MCTLCQCYDGVVTCTGISCLTPACGLSDSLTVLPGSCCPVCLPSKYKDKFKCYDGVVTFIGIWCLTPACGPSDCLIVLPSS